MKYGFAIIGGFMKILVVGGGGREHAIIKKLRESPLAGEIFCAPGNGGISSDAVCADIKATDMDGMISFAVKESFDFVVVAPDNPLATGMVDELEARGIPAFGPGKAAAEIESSKIFAKGLMKKYGIPTARYQSFSCPRAAMAYIRELDEWPVVIKADGLALGKGVVIAENIGQAEEAVRRFMEDKIFGESGSAVVVEEFITGPEVSVLAFCDGESISPMISAMDHKRAFDGNKGPNTGGMGAVAPNPHYTPEVAARCMEKIFLPTLRAMKAEGRPFKGCLYFGLMLTPKGPAVIEYNCRFGDPETQAVLPLLETDLLEIMLSVREGSLGRLPIRWKVSAAACIVLAGGGYPGNCDTGLPICGLNESGQISGIDAAVYHAGTKRGEDGFVTAGGRVLGVTATGAGLREAVENAYAAAAEISFEGMRYRKDIGLY